ncbi:TPA: ATP-dependent DNA ligase [Campylobacter jejuni]|nr:ATP-dependent DNA ligase [Campylobacter jejuni]HEH6070398.1 ATP-dependent DNA ligase [Campylobacter jejuni]
MSFIKQCKGTDYNNLTKVDTAINKWYYSTKYDGHYVQIHYSDGEAILYTSGGKPFKVGSLSSQLDYLFGKDNVILEAEFIGLTSGKLGDRAKCGKLTTLRTEYAKGIPSTINQMDLFMIFDIIDFNKPFSERLEYLKSIFDNNATKNFKLVEYNSIEVSLNNLYTKLLTKVEPGMEGIYAKLSTHMYIEGKRVKTAIKIKPRYTADLLCIGVELGNGKYDGMIGSLILKDSKGREVQVGSGLDDNLRSKAPGYFINKVIEIKYEQILDTYIQPTFERIRDDKQKTEID